ncbi:hypothetical protein ACZ91_19960, partial [Streptomyces regensis]
MRDLLDDPNINDTDRGQMLMALSNAGMVSDAEIDKYANKYGYDADRLKEGGDDVDTNLDNAKRAYRVAQRDSHKGKIDKAQKNLDDSQGFSTSDEIIDEAEPGVQLFDEFYPKYLRAQDKVGQAGGSQQQQQPDEGYPEPAGKQSSGEGEGAGGAQYSASGNTPDDIRNGLDEFRGIVFGTFHGDASMLERAGKSLDEFDEAVRKSWQDGTSDWLGDAKSAAAQRNDELNQNMGELSQALRSAPGDLRAGIDGVRDCVVYYARQVLNMYGNGRINGIVPVDVDKYIRFLDDFPAGKAQIQEAKGKVEGRSWGDDIAVAAFDGGFFGLGDPRITFPTPFFNILGYTFEGEINEDNMEQELKKAEQCKNAAETALREFMAAYDAKCQEFHGYGSEGVAAIQDHYTSMIETLNEHLGEAFGEKEGKSGDAGPGPEQQTATPPQSAGGSPVGGAPPGGGAPPAGGAPPVGGGGMSTPPTAATSPADAGGGDAAGGGPGAGGAGPDLANGPKPGGQGDVENPVTGEKAEVDPETGEPYPIDPETGEAVKDGPERETLS